jgi:hypothetical protein
VTHGIGKQASGVSDEYSKEFPANTRNGHSRPDRSRAVHPLQRPALIGRTARRNEPGAGFGDLQEALEESEHMKGKVLKVILMPIFAVMSLLLYINYFGPP